MLLHTNLPLTQGFNDQLDMEAQQLNSLESTTLIKTLTDYICQNGSDMDAPMITMLITEEVPHFTTTEHLAIAEFDQGVYNGLHDLNIITDLDLIQRSTIVAQTITEATGIGYE